MTTRRLVWCGIAVCVVVLALGLTTRILGQPPGVTEANCQRLHDRMFEADVETIFGRKCDTKWGNPLGRMHSLWSGVEGTAIVFIDDCTGLVEKVWWTPKERPPSLLARLRAWLGW
jgi:hypothetical protein